MSIFRPHKTKPRQFNYTPRYYDPVKEAFNQRRKELHGTSSETDELPYAPGDYLRMKKEARRESREDQVKSASNRLLRYGLLIVVVGLGFAYIMPRATEILTRFMDAGEATEVVEGDANYIDSDSTTLHTPSYMEHVEINYEEDEIDPDLADRLNEANEWSRTNNVTIYPNDVEIVDGKRVEESEE